MSITDQEREKRIDDVLLMLGGLEASILRSMTDKDYDFTNTLKAKRADYYERLRRLAYGLPEQRTPATSE